MFICSSYTVDWCPTSDRTAAPGCGSRHEGGHPLWRGASCNLRRSGNMSVYGAVLQGLQRFEQPWLQHKAQTFKLLSYDSLQFATCQDSALLAVWTRCSATEHSLWWQKVPALVCLKSSKLVLLCQNIGFSDRHRLFIGCSKGPPTVLVSGIIYP